MNTIVSKKQFAFRLLIIVDVDIKIFQIWDNLRNCRRDSKKIEPSAKVQDTQDAGNLKCVHTLVLIRTTTHCARETVCS